MAPPLHGHSALWLVGDGSGSSLLMVGDKPLGSFGTPPVRGRSGPVKRRLPLVPAHVTNPFRCCPVVQAGRTIVRLGRMAERLRARGQHLCGGSLRLDRVALGCLQPLAEAGRPVPVRVPLSFPELHKPRAYGVKPRVDLLPAAWRGLALTVHASQHA